MSTPIYDVDYFIAKFEATKDGDWCVRAYQNSRNQFCALGFCEKVEGGDMTREASALADLLGGKYATIAINDGDDFNYRGGTPRQRILTALLDVKKGKKP